VVPQVVFLVSEFVSIRTDIFVAGIGVEGVSNRGALRLEIINWVATGSTHKVKNCPVKTLR
jgi:hypothetical protein